MRGVVDYGLDPVVAIVDSERPGEAHKGIPIVGTVEEGLAFEPTTALVGVATQGGRFPPAWRALLAEAIRAGLDVENGLHEFIADDPELGRAGRASTASSSATCAARRPGSTCRPAPNLEVDAQTVLTVGSDCAIGKMTVSLELDRAARERGLAVRLRPDRPDRDRDRGVGNRGRRRRVGLPRGRRRAARRRGRGAGRTAPLGRRPGLAASTRCTRASRSGSSTGRRRTRTCCAIAPAPRRSRAPLATRSRRSTARPAARGDLAARAARPGRGGAVNTRGLDDEGGRGRRGRRGRTGCPRTIRSASARDAAGRRARAAPLTRTSVRSTVANRCSVVSSRLVLLGVVLSLGRALVPGWWTRPGLPREAVRHALVDSHGALRGRPARGRSGRSNGATGSWVQCSLRASGSFCP